MSNNIESFHRSLYKSMNLGQFKKNLNNIPNKENIP